ncbi:MAG TPA: aspartate kinase [Thermoanaerobaculia bacterium]|jgi:aspartate kinase|nr:aspartate kinase [Thermoanaerobaculia bacterium]
MIVMKFGGSSVDTAESIERVVGIIRSQRDRRPVVVVSAMAKTTRNLWEAADRAAAGDLPRAWALFEEIRDYHAREAPAAVPMLEGYFGELHQVLEGIAAEDRVTPRSSDHVASFGELVSSVILSMALDGVWIDCRQVVITDDQFTRARPIYEETDPRLRSALLPHLEAGRVPVLGGFVGSTRDGVTTTLGKEGSDFSAAIVGAALGAEEVQILTDVDGMMTADPRCVEGARCIRTLSFAESLELACSGAKKPHYGTLGPASRADVPIRILSSLHPGSPAKGTLIGRRNAAAAPAIKSIAWKPGAHHLIVRQPAGRVFEVCERFRPVLTVLSADGRKVEISLDRSDRLAEIRAAFSGDIEVGPGRAVVSLVSDDLATSPELAARILEIAARWEPRLVLEGAAAPCVRCLVEEEHVEDVITELHERIFQGPPGEPVE